MPETSTDARPAEVRDFVAALEDVDRTAEAFLETWRDPDGDSGEVAVRFADLAVAVGRAQAFLRGGQ